MANHKPRTENGKSPRSSPPTPPPRLPPPISAAPLTIFKVIKQAFSVSYKMDLQQQNNGFGPISKPRGRASVITASLMIVLASAVHFTIAYSSENKEGRVGFHFLLFSFALLILSFVLGELVRRLCLVSEEIRHKETRYKGSWKKVFTSTFTFRPYARTVLVVCIASLLPFFLCSIFCTNIVTHVAVQNTRSFSRSTAFFHHFYCFLLAYEKFRAWDYQRSTKIITKM